MIRHFLLFRSCTLTDAPPYLFEYHYLVQLYHCSWRRVFDKQSYYTGEYAFNFIKEY